MKALLYFLMFTFFIACKNTENNIKVQPVKPGFSAQITTIIKKYSLPYNEQIGADSNSLFFYYSANFDTSFLLHLHREGSSVIGTLYEVSPPYAKDDEDYADKKSRLLLFDGYSFEVKGVSWDSLVLNKAVNRIFSDTVTPPKNEACADCPFYFISYALRTVSSNGSNRSDFRAYQEFLKGSLLNQYIIKRKPKMPKAT